MSPWMALLILLISFAFLAKSADWFVNGAVWIAETVRVPKMVVGIVMVGFATTAPELAVSVQSAYLGHPEIALGNAVGSVIVDDAVALALAALVAPTAISVDPRILNTATAFLVGIDVLAYALAANGALTRLEGGLLMIALFVYLFHTFLRERAPAQGRGGRGKAAVGKGGGWLRPASLFSLGLMGVLLSSRGVIESSLNLASYLELSEAIIGFTIIAMGTSLPEISTCIAAARKGEGQIAVGDILGADLMNVCWIAGASAMVNPIYVSTRVIHFTMPYMILIVLVMLLCMRLRYRLTRIHGTILMALYFVYIGLSFWLFY